MPHKTDMPMRRHHCYESSQMLVVNGRYHITVSAAAAAAAAAASLCRDVS